MLLRDGRSRRKREGMGMIYLSCLNCFYLNQVLNVSSETLQNLLGLGGLSTILVAVK